jgi:hypothetical protein
VPRHNTRLDGNQTGNKNKRHPRLNAESGGLQV